MRRETCDVLIVGAGPAGAAAGVVLARAGLRVLAVDRATFPRPKTCGDALSNAALALIAELGAGPELGAAPHAVVHAGAAILPDGARIRRSYGAHPGRIVGRLDLDDLLRPCSRARRSARSSAAAPPRSWRSGQASRARRAP